MSIPNLKRSRDEASLPIMPDWSLNSENRFLFRDDKAFECYQHNVGKDRRQIADCFFFHPGERLLDEHRDLIRDWLDAWSLRGMVRLDQPFHPRVVRLFYANLRVGYDHYGVPSASSYLFGKGFHIGVEDLAAFIGAPDTLDGVSAYAFKHWPSGFGRPSEYRHWFKAQPFERGAELMSTEHLPALHRVLLLVVNCILFPQGTLSNLVRPGSLFYLRPFILKRGKPNLASLILQHMHHAATATQGYLPYGHLVEALMQRAQIQLPDMPWDDRLTENAMVHPRNLLDELTSFGWTTRGDGFLVPNPDCLVNSYILQEGAAANQYSPVREFSSPSQDEVAIEEPLPMPAWWDRQFREIHTRLNNIEAMLRALSDVVGDLA